MATMYKMTNQINKFQLISEHKICTNLYMMTCVFILVKIYLLCRLNVNFKWKFSKYLFFKNLKTLPDFFWSCATVFEAFNYWECCCNPIKCLKLAFNVSHLHLPSWTEIRRTKIPWTEIHVALLLIERNRIFVNFVF